MSVGDDNSWFSETTKTVMVTATMVILIVGMGWGYYAAHQWQEKRAETAALEEIILNESK